MSEDSEIADRGYISRDTTELMIEESEIASQEKYGIYLIFCLF
jgi:hypothetical protein